MGRHECIHLFSFLLTSDITSCAHDQGRKQGWGSRASANPHKHFLVIKSCYQAWDTDQWIRALAVKAWQPEFVPQNQCKSRRRERPYPVTFLLHVFQAYLAGRSHQKAGSTAGRSLHPVFIRIPEANATNYWDFLPLPRPHGLCLGRSTTHRFLLVGGRQEPQT